MAEDLFQPTYPSTAEVVDQSGENGEGPSSEVKKSASPAAAPAKPIAEARWQGELGIALENLWVYRSGLVILRVRLVGRVPFGKPPVLDDPEANPWGLEPDEIPAAVCGRVFVDGREAQRLGAGAVKGRWAMYLVYRVETPTRRSVSGKVTYQHLLARLRAPHDFDHDAYIAKVLHDPASWGYFEVTVPASEHLADHVPAEIFESPNLDPTVRRLLREEPGGGAS